MFGSPERAKFAQYLTMASDSSFSPLPVISNSAPQTNGTSEPWKAPHGAVGYVFTLNSGVWEK